MGTLATQLIVLVVEDEPIIRMGAVTILEDAGYLVLEAANADDATKILESRNDIQSVFTDINMPGAIDGLKLVKAIQSRWPSIRLVLTSGKIVPNKEDLPTNSRFLEKPYDSLELVTALQELSAQWLLEKKRETIALDNT